MNIVKMDSKILLNVIKNWQALCHEIDFSDIAPLLIQNHIISVDEYQIIISQLKQKRMENFLLQLLKKNEDVLLKFGKSLEKDYSWLAEKLRDGYGPDESRDETDAAPITRLESDRETETNTHTEDESDICKDCHNLNVGKRSHRLNNSINRNGSLGRRKIMKTRVKNKLKSKIQNSEALISSTTELLKPVQNEEVTQEVITTIKRSSMVSRSWTTIAFSLGLTDRVNEIRCKVNLHGEDLSMCVVYLIRDWVEKFPKTAKLSKLIDVLRCEGFNAAADDLSEILYRKHSKGTSGIC